MTLQGTAVNSAGVQSVHGEMFVVDFAHYLPIIDPTLASTYDPYTGRRTSAWAYASCTVLKSDLIAGITTNLIANLTAAVQDLLAQVGLAAMCSHPLYIAATEDGVYVDGGGVTQNARAMGMVLYVLQVRNGVGEF